MSTTHMTCTIECAHLDSISRVSVMEELFKYDHEDISMSRTLRIIENQLEEKYSELNNFLSQRDNTNEIAQKLTLTKLEAFPDMLKSARRVADLERDYSAEHSRVVYLLGTLIVSAVDALFAAVELSLDIETSYRDIHDDIHGSSWYLYELDYKEVLEAFTHIVNTTYEAISTVVNTQKEVKIDWSQVAYYFEHTDGMSHLVDYLVTTLTRYL